VSQEERERAKPPSVAEWAEGLVDNLIGSLAERQSRLEVLLEETQAELALISRQHYALLRAKGEGFTPAGGLALAECEIEKEIDRMLGAEAAPQAGGPSDEKTS